MWFITPMKKKLPNNLCVSKKHRTFAPDFVEIVCDYGLHLGKKQALTFPFGPSSYTFCSRFAP